MIKILVIAIGALAAAGARAQLTPTVPSSVSIPPAKEAALRDYSAPLEMMQQLGEAIKTRDEIFKMRMAVLERESTLKKFETVELQVAVRGGRSLLEGGEFAGLVEAGSPPGPGITLTEKFTVRKRDELLPKPNDALSEEQRLEMVKRYEMWKKTEDEKRLKQLEDDLLKRMHDAERKRQEEMQAKQKVLELAANAAAAAKAKADADRAASLAAKAEMAAIRDGNKIASSLAATKARFKAEGGPFRMPAGTGGRN